MDLDAAEIVRQHVGQLSGLPCWGVKAEYGTWISFNFGQPSLDVWEAVPKARAPHLRQRRVHLIGELRLWLEMCQWDLFQGTQRRFHSEQSRTALRKAAARLDGQILVAFALDPSPLRCTFAFDEGSKLVVRPQPHPEPSWELWHFHSPLGYIGLRSDAHVVPSEEPSDVSTILPAPTIDFAL